MSFEEAWVLPKPITTYASDELLARVRGYLPEGVAVTIRNLGDRRVISVTFDVDVLEAIATKLSSRKGQLDWNWRADMDPQRDIDVAHDERPLIRIYSNDDDNREAWPIVFSIASTLAEDLGAIGEEEFDEGGKILD